MTKRALITGITGQDGSYLAELLLTKGYEVIGVLRRSSTVNFERIAHIQDKVELAPGDLLDEASLIHILREYRPTEVYNLAAQSFVQTSFSQPVLTGEITALGVTRVLDAIRVVDPEIRFYQASSSEIFGEPVVSPQDESTPLSPLTPYGVAKAYAHFITGSYRRRYGMHASAGILYNHESPRRPITFLPRKVAHGAAAISLGLESELKLGNLSARRDWGYAADYVRAMWLILQQDEPDDYVIATGEAHSVEELVALAFAHVDLDWRDHVKVDEAFVRGKAELHNLVGSPARARDRLGWEPTRSFEELVQLLVDAELERLRGGAPAKTA